MSKALAVYFGQRLREKDDPCPTEEVCRRSNKMPLFRVGASAEEECPKCDRRFSKAGWVEGVIAETGLALPTVEQVASQTFDWAAIEATKLSHLYPVSPTPLEWTALKELAGARIEYDNAKLKRMEEERPKPAAKTYDKASYEAQSMEFIREQRRKKQ